MRLHTLPWTGIGYSTGCFSSATGTGRVQASYAASKLGLFDLTSELAVQWARRSIPRGHGGVTGFFRSEFTGPSYENLRATEYMRRNAPLPREATPTTIVVDGGWSGR